MCIKCASKDKNEHVSQMSFPERIVVVSLNLTSQISVVIILDLNIKYEQSIFEH